MLSRYLIAAFCAAFGMIAPAHAHELPPECPNYETLGSGPDLVLIPGLGSSPEVWDGVKAELSETHTVHLVHIQGFAGKELEGDPDNLIDETAIALSAYLDCKEIESATLVGHSMGGFTGLWFAIDYPDQINQLVIVDSLPFFPLIFTPDATPEVMLPQADRLRAQIITQGEEEFAQSQQIGVRSLVANPAYHETVVQWSLTSDREAFAGSMHSLMTTDLRPQLSAISVPTTIIAATNDFAPRDRVEPLYRSAYEGLEGVELRIIDDSFHFIMFDQPDAFSQVLIETLQQRR